MLSSDLGFESPEGLPYEKRQTSVASVASVECAVGRVILEAFPGTLVHQVSLFLSRVIENPALLG